MFNIETLFHPFSINDFLSDFFEKKHVVIKRNDPTFYNDLISFQDIDDVLFSQKLNSPSFRLVDSKTEVFPKQSTYCLKDTSIIDPIKFIKGYSEGHTLAMAGFQNHHFNMRQFCYALESSFGHPFQTNFYLTPANSKGFKPHWDTHDVIVLQISGKKRWKIYENSIVLADKNLEFDSEGFEAGKVIDEFELCAGDLLYIPRGLTHDAYTEDEHSLHITTGFLGYTWSQYIIEAVLNETRVNPNLRKFIPLSTLDKNNDANFDTNLKLILNDLITELNGKTGLKRFEIQRKSGQYHCSTNQLSQVMNLDTVNSESLILPRENVDFEMEKIDENIKITFLDTFIEYPDFCENTLTHLLNLKEPLTISALIGDLDEDGKLVLVKKLIKEGLISVV